jgi:hypothetical protein
MLGSGVTFGRWIPLSEAAAQAPARAGVLQLRARALCDYPTGKSAMVHYQAAADLRAAAAELAVAHAGRELLCRFCDGFAAGDAAGAAALCERLLAQFRARFGAAPHLPG